MERDSPNPCPNEQLIKLAEALGGMRDSLMTVSMALTDLVAEMPLAARNEVVTEVGRYLCRMREDANIFMDTPYITANDTGQFAHRKSTLTLHSRPSMLRTR